MSCKVCGLEKAPSDFYASNKGTCKGCLKARSRKNREDNLERCIAYDKARASDPQRLAARLEYQRTEAGKIAGSKAKKKYIELNPKKRSVHVKVGNAIRDGILMKEPCSVCQTTDNIVAHHCDYDRPFDVMWLCAKCHARWHAVNGEALNAK